MKSLFHCFDRDSVFHLVQHSSATELFKNMGFPSPFGEGQQNLKDFQFQLKFQEEERRGGNLLFNVKLLLYISIYD